MTKNRSLLFFMHILILLLMIAPEVAHSKEPPAAPAVTDTAAQKRHGWIFFPIIFYSPETKTGFGAGFGYFFREPGSPVNSRPSTILGNFIYTQRKQAIANILTDFYLKDEFYNVSAQFSYSKFPSQFYGIGNDTSEDAEEDFTAEEFQALLKAQVRLLPGFYLGPAVELLNSRLKEVAADGLLATGKIRGSSDGWVSGAGMGINWDTRDNIYFPSRGGFCQLSATLFDADLGSDYDFRRYILDLRQYLSVTTTHVLALQVYGRSTSEEVPFQLLSKLGGASQMRGYYEGRYRDHDMVVFQGEYRLPVWRRFGLVGFAGIGDVACKMSAFQVRDFKASTGFGIRYLLAPEEKLNLRFDFGFGKHTSGFYINIMEAF